MAEARLRSAASGQAGPQGLSPPDGIGAALLRREDHRLLTGAGRFSDDVHVPGALDAAFVRSPHAHARISGIEAGEAARLPGVLAILTHRELAADGIRPIPMKPFTSGKVDVPLVQRAGEAFVSRLPLLPADKVRFAGEAVAMVIATSLAAARDAAERVAVGYEALPALTRASAALGEGAPRVWEAAPSNLCLEAHMGDAAATAAAFARAAHVVRLDTWVHRVTAVPLEVRAAIASHDPQSGRLTLHAPCGSTVRVKRELAAILGLEPSQVRVVVDEIGGNFGTRNAFYPEFGLVAWAARRLGRPVRWTGDRSEAFLSDWQARDLEVAAELALDASGRILAIRTTNTMNVGAHTLSFSPLHKGAELMTSVYDIPAAHVTARAVATTMPPVISYRSSGRPEAMFVVERLIDMAAQRLGIDRVELRRRNLIAAAGRPYGTALGLTYDCGDYARVMERVLELARWHEFPARRAASARRGRLGGIGLANYLEIATGTPRERAELVVSPHGRIALTIGTLSSGQGHATSFAQLVSEWLGVPADAVDLVQGDTDRVVEGGGSHAGRSMRMAGIVVRAAADGIIERGRRIAAHVLEAPLEAIELADARFRVRGSNRSLGLHEAAERAASPGAVPADLAGPLAAVGEATFEAAAFPFGAHVCEVEVDPDTGAVEILRYVAIDDVGRAVNPLILHGQAHGAIAQGVGQAMWERCVCDPATGQPLTGSFMDYAMPRADTLPSFVTEISEQPSPTNPLGIRAGGEGGTTPALAAVVNAVVDALAPLGVEHIEMPLTPERVWRAIRDAKRRAAQ